MSVKGYKGFSKDLICLNKQYKENTTFEENGGKICDSGVIHFCQEPFEVLKYYPIIEDDLSMNEYAEVEALGDIQTEDGKSATNKLHIGAKIGLKGLINAEVEFILDKTKEVESTNENDSKDYAQIGSSGDSAQIGSSGNYAQIGSSGDYAKIGSSGNSAKIGSSGYSAQIGSSGDSAQIGSSGNYAQIGSSGYSTQIGSSGDYAKIGSSGNSTKIGSSGNSTKIGSSGNSAQIGSSGDYAKIGSSGNYAQIGSSGYSAKISSDGENSVVVCAGHNSIVKAKKGSWITLSEWQRTNKVDKRGNRIWTPKCVKTEFVDGKKIKEDTFYKLVDGEFREADSNE